MSDLPRWTTWAREDQKELAAVLHNPSIEKAMGQVLDEADRRAASMEKADLGDIAELADIRGFARGLRRAVDLLRELGEKDNG